MPKTIVVIGITGTQGGSVGRTFLQFPEWHVRGVTRDPSRPAARALAAEGIEIVQGDLDDTQSLVQALDGATVIFSNTDFFTHLFHANRSDSVSSGRTAGKYAYDREVSQGLNIAEAAESPTVLQTLEHFVYSSLSDARKWSRGRYQTVYHFDSKAETIRLIRERYPRLAAKLSLVQIGHYATNWKAFPKMAPEKQADGSFVLSRITSPTFRMPHFVAHQDTGAFVKALVDMPPGKHLFAVSEYMTFPEWAEAWGRALGVRAVYEQASRDEFFKDIPGALKEALQDGFDYIEEFGFTGGDPSILTPEQLDIKIPVTSIEEYIQSEDWSSVLNLDRGIGRIEG